MDLLGWLSGKTNKKTQKGCLDNLPPEEPPGEMLIWPINSKNTGLWLSHNVHTECRLQVPFSSKPVFEVHIKASQILPIAVPPSILGHA